MKQIFWQYNYKEEVNTFQDNENVIDLSDGRD